MTQAAAILKFYKSLKPDFRLPPAVEVMNPFESEDSWKVTEAFYKKFYSDTAPRYMIFGINPGRFGGGVTGIPFTDPIRLSEDCGIPNEFKRKAELSSEYVYEVVRAYGGAETFYKKFFVTAVSPLGFTANGINLNYYDDKKLLLDIEPFIIRTAREQLQLIPSYPVAFCLGEGTNYKIFSKLNAREKFFEHIIPLPHPRWIMQYRRKTKNEFVKKYVDLLMNPVAS